MDQYIRSGGYSIRDGLKGIWCRTIGLCFFGKIYIEEGGKLYRTLADGIVNPIIGSTIEVWQSVNGKYYVSITVDFVGYGYYTQGYILDLSEDTTYIIE